MKCCFIFCLFVIVFYSSSEVYAQSDTTIIFDETFLEDLLEDPGEETDNESTIDRFEELLIDKVNINTADVNDFLRIPFIDIPAAEIIIEHRNKFGKFFSVNELYAVQNLPRDLVEKILPFVTLEKIQFRQEFSPEKKTFLKSLYSDTRIYFRSRYVSDMQLRDGFRNQRFAGSKIKVYNRIQARYSDRIRVGFLTDKDPGENSFTDFVSGHIFFSNFGMLNSLAIGDYLVEFGQGLTLWSPYGLSKSSEAVVPVKKRERNIIPYTSSTENNFMRGAAGSISSGIFTITAFYSDNKFDANIDPVSGLITSTPVDGLHRTEGELSRKNTASERMIGTIVKVRPVSKLNLGILYYRSSFSNAFYASSVFAKTGDEFSYSAATYDYQTGAINLSGEFSYNSVSVASINHLIIRIARTLDFISSIRSYPKNFFSLHGYGFGERSGATNNEFGIYNGIRWRTPAGVLNFYFDQFKFPFSTFGNTMPVSGHEYLADLTSRPFPRVETKIRYKHELKEVNQTINGFRTPVKRVRQNSRLEISYSPVRSVRLRGRFEYSNFSISDTGTNENGFLFFQDMRWSPDRNLTFYGRLIFFRTDSFNSAVYEYENDLTGVLTNIAMFGEGMRYYFLVRYRLLRSLTVSMKYAETYKPGVIEISSGNTRIPGNTDNRLSFQLDMTL